ncbi:uncharacterized protein N7458_006609 [Penicillium daleae]|uniref:Glycine zipper 2TM domain-containing protein n=1 Tax=Penicillium daleae TaxID=63821 RepID=A0AAD6G321_9EURO|nr:uncharacterized protein N7458_006609 [Penicillium daleae]KAJ5450160.1 hypothetical protein N7458_006609 [Penicillium daleae]
MADPYNPYSSYSTPTPGGVSYYPPDEQSHLHQQPGYQYQQPYGSASPQPDANYGYAPQPNPSPSPYHLAPEPYQGNAPDRSHTPVGQPDHRGPVTTAGMPPANEGKVPENLSYYYPADQPRYTPSASPHPPPVHVSDADQHRYRSDEKRSSDQDADAEGERGIGSSLAGGAAGYYFGHKKNHGLLGAIGGAIIGNFLEDKLKDSGQHSHGHHHEHGNGHHHEHGNGHHHHHHHHHQHSRSRSHSRHHEEDDY